MNRIRKPVFKIALSIIILCIAYLYAVNGRYMKVGERLIYDKWKKEVNFIGSKEIPVIRNGEEL